MADEPKVQGKHLPPTWEGVLPILVEAAANGTNEEGRRAAWEELRRLCRIVDCMIAEQKKD